MKTNQTFNLRRTHQLFTQVKGDAFWMYGLE